jgi:hypothetical protein
VLGDLDAAGLLIGTNDVRFVNRSETFAELHRNGATFVGGKPLRRFSRMDRRGRGPTIIIPMPR